VLNTDFGEVMDLYTDLVMHDHKEKNGETATGKKQDVWVTSKNATWH
jgi:hypothetical protein